MHFHCVVAFFLPAFAFGSLQNYMETLHLGVEKVREMIEKGELEAARQKIQTLKDFKSGEEDKLISSNSVDFTTLLDISTNFHDEIKPFVDLVGEQKPISIGDVYDSLFFDDIPVPSSNQNATRDFMDPDFNYSFDYDVPSYLVGIKPIIPPTPTENIRPINNDLIADDDFHNNSFYNLAQFLGQPESSVNVNQLLRQDSSYNIHEEQSEDNPFKRQKMEPLIPDTFSSELHFDYFQPFSNGSSLVVRTPPRVSSPKPEADEYALKLGEQFDFGSAFSNFLSDESLFSFMHKSVEVDFEELLNQFPENQASPVTTSLRRFVTLIIDIQNTTEEKYEGYEETIRELLLPMLLDAFDEYVKHFLAMFPMEVQESLGDLFTPFRKRLADLLKEELSMSPPLSSQDFLSL